MPGIVLTALVGCTDPDPGVHRDPSRHGRAIAPPFVWPADLDLRVCADGTEAYVEIQDAIGVAAPGDVIGVCPGTYAPLFVGWGQELVVVGPGPDLATIDGGAASAVVVEDGTLELSGFTVTGTGERVDDTDQGGAFTVAEAELTVRDSRVTGVTGAYAVMFDEDLLVMEDVVWEANTASILWYLYQGDLAAIRRNVVSGGRHEHIALTERLHELDISGSVFDAIDIDSGFSAFQLETDGTGPFTLRNDVFHDIDDDSPWGGRVFDLDSSVSYEFLNNLVVGCDAWDLRSMDASYSLFHDNGVDYAAEVDGDGDLFEIDPWFVDPENGNFHLQQTSPAIDAGDPSEDFVDADGTRNDLGAYGGT